MFSEVMEFFGLEKELDHLGFFETTSQKHLAKELKAAISQATKEKVQPTDILESETINFLSQRLSTPLQIEQYLTLAMNEAYQVGLKPITTEFMETVLAIGLDDLEPNLIRHGYNVRSIARLLNVKPADVRSFLYNQLPPEKIQDMRDQILKNDVIAGRSIYHFGSLQLGGA